VHAEGIVSGAAVHLLRFRIAAAVVQRSRQLVKDSRLCRRALQRAAQCFVGGLPIARVHAGVAKVGEGVGGCGAVVADLFEERHGLFALSQAE
jgi:hypothetical protein